MDDSGESPNDSNQNNNKNSHNSKENSKQEIIDFNFEDKDKSKDQISLLSKSEKSNNELISDLGPDENVNDVISQFLRIKKCSVIAYGIKPSPEKLKFGFCRTCDLNLMNPICLECLYECHKKYDHDIREMNEPDNIICGCGERMHKFKILERKNGLGADECPFSDWCEKSRLLTLYIVDEKCVCEFCYRICGYGDKGRELEKEKEMLQVCECEKLNGNMTHVDLKHIFRSLEELITNKDDLIMDISPQKFFNLLFLGKASYDNIFINFEEMIQRIKELNPKNKLELKDNFLSTNFYLSLTVLTEILEKSRGTPLRYFAKEIVDKLSFPIIKNLLENIVFRDNIVFYEFLKKMLFLYKKITIGTKTMFMDKYKIKDLVNYSPLLRKIIYMTNTSLFPDYNEQISFFIDILNKLLDQDSSSMDVYDTVIEVCGILKRLSGFYLFNNTNMVLFCFAIEKIFSFVKFKNSNEKQIKLFYILTKMFVYFIYNYNDTSFYNYILDKNSNIKNVKFVFQKNELGRIISRNIIRMMYFVLVMKNYNKLSKNENNMCVKILNYGRHILDLMFTEEDNYFMNYNNKNNFPNYLIKVILIKPIDPDFINVNKEVENIEDLYYSYYIFEIDKKELLKELNNFLENIINLTKNTDLNEYLLKTNFCYIICKIFYIIDFSEIDEEKEDIEFNNNEKIFFHNFFHFLHYFIENNEYHSLIVCSHYILKGILKIPLNYSPEVLKIYAKCAKIIQEKLGIMDEISYIFRELFNFLVEFKLNDEKKFNEITQDFITIEEFTVGEQTIFYFLIVVIKLCLQTKLIHHLYTIEKIKKICIDFLKEFDFSKLHNHNECLILIIINKIFNSCSQSDRDTIMKLIPIQKIVSNLEKSEIEVDFRTELLIYLKQFKLSMFFKQIEGIKKKYKLEELQARAVIDQSNHNKNPEDPKEKKRVKQLMKNRKKMGIKGKEIIFESNIVNFFSLNDEENAKYNNYLNAIGQNDDNFNYIKNNPLISNYKYPTKYLTLYYYFIKADDTDKSFKIMEAAVEVFEKELRVFKDLFEKNINFPNKMLKYYVKGIVFPVCSIIKLIFCYTGECNGYNILMLYQMIVKMLFIKAYIMDVHNTFIGEKKLPKFENFRLVDFLKKEDIESVMEDYFLLKERNKFSPFDFTHLWEVFERNFLEYIIYPDNINLEEKFPSIEIETIVYGSISEETDMLETINLNIKKKGRSSLMRKGLLNKGRETHNNYTSITGGDIEFNPAMNQSIITNMRLKETENVKNEYHIDINDEERHQELIQKYNDIFVYYCDKKKNLNEKNSSFLISLPELSREYEINFRRILLGLLINLPGEDAGYKATCKTILYKLLVISTIDTHADIGLNMNLKDNKELGFLVNISNSLYANLIQYFINDFNYDFTRYKIYQKDIFSDIIILKYLCVEHNFIFKERILAFLNYSFSKYPECRMMATSKSKFLSTPEKDIESEDYMTFFNFLINCLHKILVITKKSHRKDHIASLYDIFFIITEFLVEVLQGNKREILAKGRLNTVKNNMSLFSFNSFISTVSEILFDDSLIDGYAFKTRLLLIGFFIAILEEKNNEEIQKSIVKFFTVNKVIASINFTMKNYFYEHTKDDIKYKEYYSNFNEKQITQREFIFDHNIFEFFKYHYYHSNVSKESKEFELANNYYKYIKELSTRGRSPEAEDLIKQVELLSEDEAKKKFSLFNKKAVKPTEISPINLINEKERSISISYIENYYIIKFFESITKVVEIRLPNEGRNTNVIFTVPSEIVYLTERTKEEFIQNVDRKNENSKKFELVRGIPLFQLEIEYFKNTKVRLLSKFILNIDFYYVQIIIYIIGTIFLVFMLFTSEGYIGTESIEPEPTTTRRLYRSLIQIPEKITNAIEISINKWGFIYNLISYIFCGLNGIFILSWVIVKMPLYFTLDKYKYMEENKIENEKDLSFGKKIFIMIFDSIIGRDYINSLLFMFIISLIGSIMPRGEIVYAFILLIILDLNTTLKSIVASIKVKGPELGASFLLLIFLVYFYSNLGFFYLNDNFAADIENDIPDNYCLSLNFCFMTNFDAGIRARGGAADQMVRISFERHTKVYVIRLIYDVSYFLINIIIMIDLVFGIILGTFSKMREEERECDNDKINHCFICHITREIIEKRKENFQFHRDKRHNLWIYINYMLYLKFWDPNKLNVTNLATKANLDNKNISFLPSYQDNFNDDEQNEKEKEKDEEEEEASENDMEEEEESDSESNSSDLDGVENNDRYI